jgi:hypothetical protein
MAIKGLSQDQQELRDPRKCPMGVAGDGRGDAPFTVHRSPFTVHRSPFTVHRSAFEDR